MEVKYREVLTEHEPPEYLWYKQTVEGTRIVDSRIFDPNLTTHEICMHLLERIEELERSLREIKET